MKNVFAPRRLDLKRFAEDGAPLQGEQVLADFPRLLAEAQGQGGGSPVHWGAVGELRNPGHAQPEVWLHLDARATLPLTCQRCLGPVPTPVEVRRSFRFVADEAAAAAEDDQSEEDVLALSRAFDLVELVEDELLMALPLVPRHETCPDAVKMQAVDPGFEAAQAPAANPFAVLQALKDGKTSKP